jgi:hypothetical protein
MRGVFKILLDFWNVLADGISGDDLDLFLDLLSVYTFLNVFRIAASSSSRGSLFIILFLLDLIVLII